MNSSFTNKVISKISTSHWLIALSLLKDLLEVSKYAYQKATMPSIPIGLHLDWIDIATKIILSYFVVKLSRYVKSFTEVSSIVSITRLNSILSSQARFATSEIHAKQLDSFLNKEMEAVKANMSIAFPDKSPNEIEEQIRSYYTFDAFGNKLSNS